MPEGDFLEQLGSFADRKGPELIEAIEGAIAQSKKTRIERFLCPGCGHQEDRQISVVDAQGMLKVVEQLRHIKKAISDEKKAAGADAVSGKAQLLRGAIQDMESDEIAEEIVRLEAELAA